MHSLYRYTDYECSLVVDDRHNKDKENEKEDEDEEDKEEDLEED